MTQASTPPASGNSAEADAGTDAKAAAGGSRPAMPARVRKANAIGGRHHFLLRRLHSLSGIIPVGVFVMFHLFTNAQLALGTFQHEVEWIHAMPALFIMELVIWLSIAFHAVLGLAYTFTGSRWNTHNYEGNWRYMLQRVSGILALIFIFLHIATLRWRWDLGGWFTPFFVEVENPDGSITPLATATTANALQYAWWVVAIYVVGVLAVVYHWANGLWTAAITWGLTISEQAQKRWGYICAAVGLTLTLFFGMALGGALAYDVTEAEAAAIERAAQQYEEGAIPLPGTQEIEREGSPG